MSHKILHIFSTEQIFEELLKRTQTAFDNILLNRWNSFYVNNQEYAIKIEKRD